jgi:hypothetical protein
MRRHLRVVPFVNPSQMSEARYTLIRKSHMPVTMSGEKGLATILIEETLASGNRRAKNGANAGFRLDRFAVCGARTGNQEVPLALISRDSESLISRVLPVWGSTIL